MAFAKSISVVLDKMKQLNTPYYSVFEPDGKTILSENDNDISPDEARDELDEILHNLEGSVKVVLRLTSKKSRPAGGALGGSHIYSLRLSEDKRQSVGGMDNTTMGLMQQNFESKLDAIKKDYEFREEMRSLKEDLKKNDNSTTSLTEILEHLKPFLPMIMSKLGMIPASPSIAGNEAEIIESEIDPVTITKLNEAIAQLMSIDENFVETIEILAKFAKSAPEQYKSFIPILKSQVK